MSYTQSGERGAKFSRRSCHTPYTLFYLLTWTVMCVRVQNMGDTPKTGGRYAAVTINPTLTVKH